MAPGGPLVPSGDRNHWRDFCTAWRLAAMCASPGSDGKPVALERALAPSGEVVPPGGLEQFRLAACVLGQAKCCCSCFVFVCCLSTDTILGSGDAVP